MSSVQIFGANSFCYRMYNIFICLCKELLLQLYRNTYVKIKYHYEIMKENASLSIMIRIRRKCFLSVLHVGNYPGGFKIQTVRSATSRQPQRPCEFEKIFLSFGEKWL